MSNKVKIIKRLEAIKNSIELEDDEIVELHLTKLKGENDDKLKTIITLVEEELITNDGYSKISQAIDEYVYGYKDAKLTSHQQEILNDILDDFDTILLDKNEERTANDNFVVLSGFAGVGKTFVTSKLVKAFLDKKYKILLTTPTHKSLYVAKYMLNSENIRVNTSTLHSYLDVKLHTDYLNGTKLFKRKLDDKQYDYEKNLDILIVDESSMVNDELFNFIEENLAQHKLKSVLFIGDEYQLPPVSDDKKINAVITLKKQYKLTQVVRQAHDSYIKEIAITIKDCIKNENYIDIFKILDVNKYAELEIFNDKKSFIQEFSHAENWWDDDKIILSYTNYNVDNFNRTLRYKSWIDRDITPTNAIIEGDVLVFNEGYQNEFENSEIVKVVQAEKRKESNVNISYYICKDKLGRSFRVIDPDDTSTYIDYLNTIRDEANQAKKKKDDELRRKKWRYYFALKDEFADLKYKFATTIHKSQGSTYKTVYIDVASIVSIANKDKNFAYRLLYVAVTRASNNIKILL